MSQSVVSNNAGANVQQCIFESREDLVSSLADHIVNKLSAAITKNGKASLVVSGGSTPKVLFQQLCDKELDWANVVITLADERWVEPTDSASNEKLVRETLLVSKAAAASFIPHKNAATTPEEGCAGLEAELSHCPAPFTILMLGMGGDGHTASLFPCSEQLAAGLDMESGRKCLAVHPTTAPHGRMSLSLPALLNSDEVILLITGDDKWDVYQAALAGDDVTEFPVRSVIHQAVAPFSVYWAA